MKVAVLGGGITGLTAAWKLSESGHSVRLLEAAPMLGGPVRTEIRDGWMAEAGPNSLREGSADMGDLINELGLAGERIESAPAASKRFLAHRGRLVALPGGPAGLLATPLLSVRSKLRVLCESRRPPVQRPEDISVAAFMRDHFGSEVVDRIVQPFVSGYCAGDPESLSTRILLPWAWEAEQNPGSLLRARMAAARRRRKLGLQPTAPTISFRTGMGALTAALARRIQAPSIQLGAEVRSLRPEAGAGWRVSWREKGADRNELVDRVVAALPAAALAALEIGAEGRRPLSELASIACPPVATLTLGFRREQVSHPLDGFGALVPATERLSILGIVFVSSLFPGRAPDGHVALTVLVGGALQSELALLPPDQLVEKAGSDLNRLIGAKGAPIFASHALWPTAIPQYSVGYDQHLASLAECERENPGLYFGGSVRNGISVPDCLAAGKTLASRVFALES
ncbi:MAG TPA: protoporphyrinogen oxidase [Opitutaceae bacterium]|jgi:oxygen-dependent protoporphyrinogen oxidase